MASEKETKKFVSDDGVSTAATPVKAEGGEPEIDPKKAKEDKSVKGVDEAFEALIATLEVTEDFKRQVTAIFESAVELKAKSLAEQASDEIRAEIQAAADEIAEAAEQKNKGLTEQYKAESEQILEGVSKFLDYIAERYLEENALAIESSIAVERANRIVEGIADVLAVARVDLDESKIDLFAELEEKAERIEEDYNDILRENVQLKTKIQSFERDSIIGEISEGLTESQKEQLNVLSKKLSFSDIDVFRSDVKSIKESVFNVAPKPGQDLTERQEIEGGTITGNITANEDKKVHFNEVDAIIEAINKLRD